MNRRMTVFNFRPPALRLGELAAKPTVGGLFDRLRSRIGWQGLSFWTAVLAPTLCASIYFGLIASDRYVAEAQFVVRGVSSRRATGLEMLFQTFGIARTVDDANAVQSYMLSRDAVRALEARLPIREIFGRKSIDAFSRFPHFWRGDSFERLYDYYLDRVSVTQESSKGITLITVQAFDAKDAQRICAALLELGEAFINRMNVRAQKDTVKSALEDLAAAEQRLISAQRDLTQFRMREGLIDPAKDSSSTLETITTLSTEMAHALAQIGQKTEISPMSPAIPAMKAQVESLRSRIESERRKLAGDDSALGSKLAVYEQLSLNRAFAERNLGGASTSLDAARQEAQRQAIYIEQVVSPNLPDEPTEPQRLRLVVTVFTLSFAMSSVVWLLRAGAKEHAIE